MWSEAPRIDPAGAPVFTYFILSFCHVIRYRTSIHGLIQ